MTHFPFLKFIAIDGLAILISVPTQVLLANHFGEHILGIIKKFKLVLFSVIALVALYFLFKKAREVLRKRKHA